LGEQLSILTVAFKTPTPHHPNLGFTNSIYIYKSAPIGLAWVIKDKAVPN